MSVLDVSPPVPVEVGPCRCAGSPHEQDIVYLHAEAPMDLGLAAEAVIYSYREGEQEQATVGLGRVYVAYGVADWTFLDDDGQQVPVSHDNAVRALPWDRGGREVATKAAELYNGAVLRPLVERASKSSRVTSIGGSTSANPQPGRVRQKRSA